MLPTSILREVSAATILKCQHSQVHTIFSLPNSKLPACAKFPSTIVNSFRQKSLGLLPEGGDSYKVTFADEKCDKAEVFIKTIAIEKKFLDTLANPKRGYVVRIKPFNVF